MEQSNKRMARRHGARRAGVGRFSSPERHVANQPSRLDTAKRLLARLGEPGLPETVLQLGCEMLGADQAVVYLLDARQSVAPVARYPAAAATHPADALDGARLTWDTLRRSLPQFVDCAHDDEARWEYCRGGECWPILSVPLQWEGQNFAVVQLAYARWPGAIAAGTLRLVHEYADLAALALVQHLRLSPMAGLPRREMGHGEGAHERSYIAGVSAALAAGESERERIARDLHDGARQALLGAQLHLAALGEALLREDARAMETHLIHGRAALDAVEQELARVVRDLSPPRLDEGDLAAALRELAEQWAAATQIRTHCAFDPCVPSLEVARAVPLYRIVQEALANCSRHAHASSVTLSLFCDERHLNLIVADDGCGGAAVRGGGLGLLSMAQRAHAIGAELALDSPPGGGTRVVVRLPLDRPH